VDGPTVTTTTTTSSTGLTTTIQTVAPVPANTSNAGLAVIPLATDNSGNPLVQVSLPPGVGLSSEAVTGEGLTLREQLINASSPRVSDAGEIAQIITNGIDQYLPTLSDQEQLTVRTIALSVPSGTTNAPNQPIVIRGVADDPANPQRQEALIIDARNLPPGTVLDFGNVELAIIMGPTTLTGGLGQNFVIGDNSRQSIVLGPDDDVLRGGGGDDTVGSKGGNDQLFGDEGNDWLVGGIGNDILQGGSGNDILQGGVSDAGRWSFKLAADGALQVRFAPTSTELADSAGISVTEVFTTASGQGEITDARFAWIYDDYSLARDTALLIDALLQRLPTLGEMGEFASGKLSSQQLGELAHAFWVQTSGSQAQALQTQVQGVIKTVWGANAATTELVALGVNHLNGGGTWGDIWLTLARDSRHASTMKDAQGNWALIDQALNGIGWQANSGDDQLFGGDGNDVLIGGVGNDLLDGGSGADIAVLFGAVADFEVSVTASTQVGAAAGAQDVLIRSKLTGDVDTLRGIEFAKIGHTIYSVANVMPGLVDSVYAPLEGYVQPVTDAQLVGTSWHADWVM
jgi:hypothetical protein